MKTETNSQASAEVYSTRCIDAKTAEVLDGNGQRIATLARPVTLPAIRAAIAKTKELADLRGFVQAYEDFAKWGSVSETPAQFGQRMRLEAQRLIEVAKGGA